MNHDVFISYSSRNKPTALAICHVLEGHGVRCWMAPRDIPPGADYGDVIDEAIVACRLFVLVFSEPASLSQWVKGELNLAFTEKKIIIPYRIDETPLKGAMRLILNQTHWVDAYPDAESKFGELVEAAERFLGRPAVGAFRTEPVVPPSAPTPAPARRYKVGDYYNVDGKRGVVFEVDTTGEHGKIVSLTEKGLYWSTDEEYDRAIVMGAIHRAEGLWNQRIIERIDGWREKYPAFAWCAAQGDGWYLPAIEEVKILLLNKTVHDVVNRTLERVGGVALSAGGTEAWYWSSTEVDEYCAVDVILACGEECCEPKAADPSVRAVSAFWNSAFRFSVLSCRCGGTFFVGPAESRRGRISALCFFCGGSAGRSLARRSERNGSERPSADRNALCRIVPACGRLTVRHSPVGGIQRRRCPWPWPR